MRVLIQHVAPGKHAAVHQEEANAKHAAMVPRVYRYNQTIRRKGLLERSMSLYLREKHGDLVVLCARQIRLPRLIHEIEQHDPADNRAAFAKVDAGLQGASWLAGRAP